MASLPLENQVVKAHQSDKQLSHRSVERPEIAADSTFPHGEQLVWPRKPSSEALTTGRVFADPIWGKVYIPQRGKASCYSQPADDTSRPPGSNAIKATLLAVTATSRAALAEHTAVGIPLPDWLLTRALRATAAAPNHKRSWPQQLGSALPDVLQGGAQRQ